MMTWEETTSLLTTKTKMFASDSIGDLESQVNTFLKDCKMVVDVKVNVTAPTCLTYRYIATVIYREFKDGD